MSLIKAIIGAMLNKKVTPAQKQQRLSICNTCPHLYTPTRQCSQCLCFVDAKTEIKTEHCPLYKWGVVV